VIPSAEDEPTITVEVIAPAFHLSTDGVYDLVRSGRFPIEPKRLGRKMVWVTAEVRSFLGLDQ
jgi:predicted DNA-binding transcriptional regulator AlpA